MSLRNLLSPLVMLVFWVVNIYLNEMEMEYDEGYCMLQGYQPSGDYPSEHTRSIVIERQPQIIILKSNLEKNG